MTSLLVMIPVRNRPEKIPGLIKSYDEATTGAGTELMFISDSDDDSYKDTDWGNHVHAVLSPREYVVGKMNRTALSCADSYDAIMFAQDDNLFVTPGWDEIMLKVLEGMGGTGMIYPDDKRRNDIPEIIMISTDIITELGLVRRAVPEPLLHRSRLERPGQGCGAAAVRPRGGGGAPALLGAQGNPVRLAVPRDGRQVRRRGPGSVHAVACHGDAVPGLPAAAQVQPRSVSGSWKRSRWCVAI